MTDSINPALCPEGGTFREASAREILVFISPSRRDPPLRQGYRRSGAPRVLTPLSNGGRPLGRSPSLNLIRVRIQGKDRPGRNG